MGRRSVFKVTYRQLKPSSFTNDFSVVSWSRETRAKCPACKGRLAFAISCLTMIMVIRKFSTSFRSEVCENWLVVRGFRHKASLTCIYYVNEINDFRVGDKKIIVTCSKIKELTMKPSTSYSGRTNQIRGFPKEHGYVY